jgi:hypothetical protein
VALGVNIRLYLASVARTAGAFQYPGVSRFSRAVIAVNDRDAILLKGGIPPALKPAVTDTAPASSASKPPMVTPNPDGTMPYPTFTGRSVMVSLPKMSIP